MRYWALVRAGYRRYSSYRAAAFAGVFTNTIFGFIRAGILLAVFEAAGPIGGYDRQQVLTYTFLAQGFIAVLAIWNWIELGTRIQSGDVVTDLQRPIDMQSMYMAEDYGRAGFQAVFRGVPPFVVGAIVYDLYLPASVARWAAFAVSVVLAVAVSFGIRWLFNLAAFWILDWRGLQIISAGCATLLSGLVLPIAYFPPAIERIMSLLPWASTMMVPIDIFLGRHTGAGLAGALLLQTTWVVALWLAGRFVLTNATRRVVVQGG